MTGTSARNTYGIFKTKRAKLLAIKYNLDLNNPLAYAAYDIVKYIDVVFVVNNLWLNHFLFKTPKPILLDPSSYYEMYDSIYFKYTDVFEHHGITYQPQNLSSFV